MYVVEIERPDGSRFWSPPILPEDVDEYIAHFESLGYGVSDVDTASETAV